MLKPGGPRRWPVASRMLQGPARSCLTPTSAGKAGRDHGGPGDTSGPVFFNTWGRNVPSLSGFQEARSKGASIFGAPHSRLAALPRTGRE